MTISSSLEKCRQPVAVLRGEIGSAVEGHLLGGEKHRQRPAAAAPDEELNGVLINLVEVGPLLAIDLDVDEVLVHPLRGLFILERFVLHHVAPVAGGVADGEEDRLVLIFGLFKRLLPPGVPIDRIVRMLEEIRAGFVNEAIGVLVLIHWFYPFLFGLKTLWGHLKWSGIGL
ncbi:MAG: hypothetical protein MPW15_17510 [Candidatus Manganitrophus sp.]|nr:hypothetical protein [Candidatus Manganitrophus sp.]